MFKFINDLFCVEFNKPSADKLMVEILPTRRGFLIHLAVRGLEASELAIKL